MFDHKLYKEPSHEEIFAIFLLLCGTAQADPLPMVTLKLVKAFDKYKCNSYDGMMGGNGNAIFTRPGKVKDPQQLSAVVAAMRSGIFVLIFPHRLPNRKTRPICLSQQKIFTNSNERSDNIIHHQLMESGPGSGMLLPGDGRTFVSA
ncbi:MAG: hypothetical protein IPN81_09045 [Nitrosomonadales bacterium]|nr:hypothetical protein [Nitrosomonadales bacterium]